MRNIKISFDIDNYENIYNKVPFKVRNNFGKRVEEKGLDLDVLSEMTGIKKTKLDSLLEDDFSKITLKDLIVLSYVLTQNPSDLIDIKIFEDSSSKEGDNYPAGFIDGLYYAIQIVKNLDVNMNLDRLLDFYNRIKTE
jgi:DNA-binding Xre family transcriptional regulator